METEGLTRGEHAHLAWISQAYSFKLLFVLAMAGHGQPPHFLASPVAH